MKFTPDTEQISPPGRSILVWDTEGDPPRGEWTTLLWSGYGNHNDNAVVSVPMLVEEHALALRSRYLSWIYKLGETIINGKRLIDHLELRPGLSYWWMTSVAQRFNASESSQIDNAVKAFVFEKLVDDRKPEFIMLESPNDKLAEMFRRFCKKRNLRFQWRSAVFRKSRRPSLRTFYSILPCPLKAVIYFAVYSFRWRFLFRSKKKTEHPVSSAIAFVDILTHLNKKTFASGCYMSNYWTSLVDSLGGSEIRTTWIHNYFQHGSVPTPVHAQRLIERFNRCNPEMQTHILIEENLTLSILLQSLRYYIQTVRNSYRISMIKRHFQPAGSQFDFWPLLKQEWTDTLRGHAAIVNCLRIQLYEETFRKLPYQKIGVYIQENQPWEMALIYAWKCAGHGMLIGVPHTNVRFWDLRYYYDPRTYVRTGRNDLPIPDRVAVNGPLAKKSYYDGGYPEEQIEEAEALRFLHLINHHGTRSSSRSNGHHLRVLVCGDFSAVTNARLISWISIATEHLPEETSYIIKPHPAYDIKNTNILPARCTLSSAPLSELFEDCDVVFTSNITSAAVDAYLSGMPVVQMLDGATFNMSPLRGLKGVKFVANPLELAEALRKTKQHDQTVADDFFYLDPELPRWKKLLSIDRQYADSTA